VVTKEKDRGMGPHGLSHLVNMHTGKVLAVSTSELGECAKSSMVQRDSNGKHQGFWIPDYDS
jgi:hypothetical protein